jgi:ADP-ribose pyrophosphatase YjhB (NUDIX family)
VRRWALVVFRFLPRWLRRLIVHLGAPSYSVGAVVVLRRPDGRVLFVDQRHSGGWALPGGLLRRREPAAEALVREVSEEVGIELSPEDLPLPIGSVEPRARRVDIVYLQDVGDAEVAKGADEAEVRGVGWFHLDELPEVTDPTLYILRSARLL